MVRRVQWMLVALALAPVVGTVARETGFVIPDFCTVAPWFPGCTPDGAGGGGSGAA